MAKPSFKQSLLSSKAVGIHLLFGGTILLLSIELLRGNAPPDFGAALAFALIGYPVVLLLLWCSDRQEHQAKAEYEREYLTAPDKLLMKRRRWRSASLAFLLAAAVVLIYFGGHGLRVDFIPAHYMGYALFGFGVLGALGVNIWYGGPLDFRGDPPPAPDQPQPISQPVSRAFNRPTTDPRERLLARIGDINDPASRRPLVTLEEFFEGNDDPGSIGYNLPEPPEPREFYELLLAIRDKPSVADVRIEVMQLEDPDGWPNSDTIWVITSSTPDEVRSWFPERLAPDEVYDDFQTAPHPLEVCSIPAGMRAVGVWYD